MATGTLEKTERLSDDAVRDRLGRLPGWEVREGALCRTYEFPDFVHAMQFVTRVAEIAEAVQHHPDIDIRYSKVTLALVTHDSGGITEKDFAMAHEAETAAGR